MRIPLLLLNNDAWGVVSVCSCLDLSHRPFRYLPRKAVDKFLKQIIQRHKICKTRNWTSEIQTFLYFHTCFDKILMFRKIYPQCLLGASQILLLCVTCISLKLFVWESVCAYIIVCVQHILTATIEAWLKCNNFYTIALFSLFCFVQFFLLEKCSHKKWQKRKLHTTNT